LNKENLITQIKKNSSEVYRVYEKEYEGYRFIDVRIYYQDRKTQEWKPTTKGISIMPNNAEEIINGIIKAMEVMGFTKKPTLDDVEQIQQGIENYKSDNS
tara:strand:+ start:596 stop:895 length:300 start_codon:yes stop_codon:yes gene_type:complete